jgi:hypothetical protein
MKGIMDIVSLNVDLPTDTTDPHAFLVALELTLTRALRHGDLITASTIANLIIVIGQARHDARRFSVLRREETLH